MPLERYSQLPKAPDMLNEAELARLSRLLVKFIQLADSTEVDNPITLMTAWAYFVGLAPRRAQLVFDHFLNDRGRLSIETIAHLINRPNAQDRLRHQVIADVRILANILDPAMVESLYLSPEMVAKLLHLNIRTVEALAGCSRIDLRQRPGFSTGQIDQIATALANHGQALRYDPPPGSNDYGLQALLIGEPDESLGIRTCNALLPYRITLVSQILPMSIDQLILIVRGFGEKSAKHLQDRLRDRLGIAWPGEEE